MKKLPVGTQAFEKLRKDGAIYIDKTEHIYNLINNGSVYFLSRPRRFGKSLLISTFKELFKCNKEIFEGLYVYDKWDWTKKYPVIHLDFTELAYDTPTKLENSLSDFITRTAIEYSIELISSEIETRFSELIEKLHKSTGQQVVVLIDEYDKPMIDNLVDKEVYDKVKRTLHDFYQVIKGSDEHIKFMFMTGVSRFAGLSVFSALNNLYDITMSSEYTSICGYTQEELESNFKEYIEVTAEYMGISKEKLLSKIKYWYNGYMWKGKESVYNPFSIMTFFRDKKFSNYWFNTGTPTFLIEQIKYKDLKFFEQEQKVTEYMLSNFNEKSIDITGLLFQTGYLTIKKEMTINDTLVYELDFPNKEVKNSFLMVLVSEYAGKSQIEIFDLNIRIQNALINKNEKELEEALRELYANAVYDMDTKQEGQRQSLFVFAARLSGFETEVEVHTDKGRADVVLRKENKVIVVEIKYGEDKSIEDLLEKAMEQIRERKYYEKYGSKEVILLALAFGRNKKSGKNRKIGCKFESI